METVPVTSNRILTATCIVCGDKFDKLRAGKLYCSQKCKQFSYYHKTEISALKERIRIIACENVTLKLSEFEAFNDVLGGLYEWKNLRTRKTASWYTFKPEEEKKLEEYELSIPETLRNVRLRKLSLEAWSFFKVLYPVLSTESLIKTISGLDSNFIMSMQHVNSLEKDAKHNPVSVLFNKHIEKLAEGKIRFGSE